MFRNLPITVSFGVMFLSTFAVGAETNSQTQELNPFTHLASIPSAANLDTIRFEKVRIVQAPTVLSIKTERSYCAELAFRDPGGSAYCPSERVGSLVPAYEVTYSFDAPPAVWDESGERRGTFRVYFRPEELTPKAQQALSARKRDRANVAEYFTVKTYPETAVQRLVVDEKESRFCEGSFVEGAWVQRDSRCADTLRYKTVAIPSGAITVRVDPASETLSAKR